MKCCEKPLQLTGAGCFVQDYTRTHTLAQAYPGEFPPLSSTSVYCFDPVGYSILVRIFPLRFPTRQLQKFDNYHLQTIW